MWKGSEHNIICSSIECSDHTSLKGFTGLGDMDTHREVCSCFTLVTAQCCV